MQHEGGKREVRVQTASPCWPSRLCAVRSYGYSWPSFLRSNILFMMHTNQQYSRCKKYRCLKASLCWKCFWKDTSITMWVEFRNWCCNFSVTLNLVLSSPRSFHHGELLVWYELLDVRHSSLPAHCHSPSVIRDKKTYGTWTSLQSLGVCVAYPDSQINQMPRDGQGSSLCENTLLMSLFLSTSSSPVFLLSPLFIIPSLAFSSFLSLPLIALHSHHKHRSVLELSSRRTCQLKGRRKDRQGSCLWP